MPGRAPRTVSAQDNQSGGWHVSSHKRFESMKTHNLFHSVLDLCCTQFGEGKDKVSDSAQRGMATHLASLLREVPELADEQDTRDTGRAHGMYPLHAAAQYGNIHALRVLIEAGASLNVTKNNGATPLCVVIHAYGVGSKGNEIAGPNISAEEWERRLGKCFSMLIEAGADVNAGHSILGGPGFDLGMACVGHSYSRPDVCLPLLKRLVAVGLMMNSALTECGGHMACHAAVKRGHLRCLEILLLAGADPTLGADFPDIGRKSAFDLAKMYANEDGDGIALETFARVGAVISGMTTELIRDEAGGPALDPKHITRCRAELRRRARLTEKRRRIIDQDHGRAAARAMDMARQLLQADRPWAARVAYTDALLSTYSPRLPSALDAPIVDDDPSPVPRPRRGGDTIFENVGLEALYNLVSIEQMLAADANTYLDDAGVH
eukprot:4288770-Prymnesium_polylepis.1